MINGTTKPFMNHRGLWADLDITYEGLIVVILQTKLNLMKLKEPPGSMGGKIRVVHLIGAVATPCVADKNAEEKSAIFHSDIDDTAESSSDDEAVRYVQVSSPSVDSKGFPVTSGGVSTRSKKLMKMVDRITESKLFQAASENKFIKKAMEGEGAKIIMPGSVFFL